MTRKRALPVNGVDMAPEIFLKSKSLRMATAGDVAFENMFVYLCVLALSSVNNVSLVWICLAYLRSQRRENSFWQESQISCRCFPRVFRDVRWRIALRRSSGTGQIVQSLYWDACRYFVRLRDIKDYGRKVHLDLARYHDQNPGLCRVVRYL